MIKEALSNIQEIIDSSPELKRKLIETEEYVSFAIVLGGMAMLAFSDNPSAKTIGIAANLWALQRSFTSAEKDF